MFKACLLSTLMFAGSIAAPALAQDQTAVEPSYEAPAQFAPSWSDKGIAQVADQLIGTWKSSDTAEDGAELWMTVAAAPVPGMSDMLFVESVRSTSPWDPYRYSFFQLYRYKGEIRLRTYELARDERSKGAFAGMWGATEHFPAISADTLIATLDVELESSNNGFAGSTPYPYPTGVAGAVEMTSSITVDGDTMTVADRGYDANGDVVWGAQSDSAYTFSRSKPYAQVTRFDDGMIFIDYAGEQGLIPENGDQLSVHYTGFLTDLSIFDSSYDRGTPFTFVYPPGNRAIAGWELGMKDFAIGTHRKIIIPGYLGYGERGNPRAAIPGNAVLFFNAYMAHIDRPEKVESEGVSNGAASDPQGDHSGHSHDHSGHSHD